MKKFFLHILLLHLTVAVNAATYYFSSSAGNDSYTSTQAQSTATPWKTIAKLNAIMSTLKAGDKVMFKRGETFDGAIVITVSGTSTSPITFSAYGAGNKPTINGFTSLSGWTQSRSNVWEASLNVASGKESMVTMNDLQQAIGRYPNRSAANGGYMTIDSHNGLTELVGSQLSASSNWTGGDIVIRKNRWTLDRSAVTYQYGGTIGFVSGSTASITDKFGFFIENHTNTLDQDGEWFYDKTRGKLQMYFSSNNPGAYAVKASAVETLVSISFQSYISFSNLNFTGANSYAINLTNSNNISVNNCGFSYTGINAVIGLSSNYLTFTNSNINNANNNGVYMYWNCSNAVITDNTIKNTALIPGMAQNSVGTHQGIVIRGDYNLIQYNEIDSTGANGVHFEGNYSTVANNFVNYFGMTVDDCGGLYTGQGLGDNSVYLGKSILNNIVLNGVGAPYGTSDTTAPSTQGIYLDANTNHTIVSGNTLANCGQAGIFSNINNNVTITNNTMFNNGIEQFLGTKQLAQGNVTVTNNIMFSKTATQLGTRIESTTGNNDVAAFGSFDSNYYCRPIDNNYQFFSQYYFAGTYYKSYDNLSTWASKFGYDKNSKGAPATIAPFVYGSPTGLNKYTNGAYNSTVGDVGSFSATGDMAKTWVANKLDAGTMQVSSSNYTTNNTYMLTLPLNSSVETGKSYLLSFSLQGGAAGRPMEVYLRTTTTGNADLTTRTKIPIDVTRNDVQFGLTANATSGAAIELDVAQPNGALWVDNVNLQEATVTPTNMDDYIVFKYNPTKTSRKFSVSGSYYDAKGNTYTGKITLAPYSSIVLFKQDGTTSAFKTSTEKQSIKMQGTMTDASAASFTASSSAKVNWQVENQSSKASYYTIERSLDAANFMLITKTMVKKTEGSAISYEYNDAAPKAGKNWYRITQYDEKGVAGVSSVVTVNNLSFQVNPNPVQNIMHLFFNGVITANDQVGKEVVIRNLSGITVKSMQLPATQNISMANFDVSSLKTGMYILSMTSEGKTISKQFLKQ